MKNPRKSDTVRVTLLETPQQIIVSQEKLALMSTNKSHGQLANPAGMRSLSDKLDDAAGWSGGYKESSGTRGFIHGVWHTGAGVVAAVTPGNNNAKGEFGRAGDQFSKIWK